MPLFKRIIPFWSRPKGVAGRLAKHIAALDKIDKLPERAQKWNISDMLHNANGGKKMRCKKAYEVMEELMRSGFSMTTREFFETTIEKILKKYQIREKLAPEEYYKLLTLLLDECALVDLKSQGIDFFDDEDWRYK